MNWTRKDAYYQQSDEGYRVSRTGPAGSYRYSAWAPRLTTMHAPCLGVYVHAAEARDACERHRDELQAHERTLEGWQ